MIEHKDYYSTYEVAKLLGVSRVAVFKRIKNGQLMAKKIGRNYIIAAADFGLGNRAFSQDDIKALDLSLAKALKEYDETLRLLGKE